MPKFQNYRHARAFAKARKDNIEARRRRQRARRMKLVELIDSGEYDYNDLDELAELFGVHPLTIRRDRAALAKDYGVCSHCGQLRPEFTEMMAAELS